MRGEKGLCIGGRDQALGDRAQAFALDTASSLDADRAPALWGKIGE